MDFLSSNTKLIVYKKPINMHRSYDGLLSLAISELKVNPKQAYVLFINRDRNQFKILCFYKNNISIFSMRLSGSMKADFSQIDEIDVSSLVQLMQSVRSRKSRFEMLLEA
jgi:IS66 Orf2 like protein